MSIVVSKSLNVSNIYKKKRVEKINTEKCVVFSLTNTHTIMLITKAIVIPDRINITFYITYCTGYKFKLYRYTDLNWQPSGHRARFASQHFSQQRSNESADSTFCIQLAFASFRWKVYNTAYNSCNSNINCINAIPYTNTSKPIHVQCACALALSTLVDLYCDQYR